MAEPRRSIAAILAGFATFSLASPAISQVQLRDGSHDMDFNFGTWHTEISRTPDPFGDPSKTVRLSGKVTVRPVWNGRAALEEIEADGQGGHWEGANLFFYDPQAHQWNQHYIDSSEGRFDEPPGIGEYRSGNVEYYSSVVVGGRVILDRAIWSEIKPDSHMYEEDFSNDGGRTWHPAFVAHLTRVKS